MVVLTLDLEQTVAEEDSMFISVRIGDQQKLSRLAASRTYKFPKSCDKHYGKIEIFQRVGAGYVDVDPSNKFDRQVCINVGDSGDLGFKIAVEESESRGPRGGAKDPTNEPSAEKTKAAKEYLQKHGLEARLSEAMQALLRERPEEPAGFLAGILMESVSPQRREAAMLAGSQTLKLTAEKLGTMPKPASRSRAAAKRKAPPPRPSVSSLTPFRAYYSANMACNAGPGAVGEGLLSKFPAYRTAREPVASPKPPAAKPAQEPPSSSKAAATRKAPPPRPSVSSLTPFRAYYSANMACNAGPGSVGEGLLSKFPAYRTAREPVASPKPPGAKPAQEPPSSKARPAVSALKPFGSYYTANFSLGPASAAKASLFEKFPAYRRAREVAAPEALKPVVHAVMAAQELAKGGPGVQRPAVSAISPFGRYYTANFDLSSAAGGCEFLYAKFGAFRQACEAGAPKALRPVVLAVEAAQDLGKKGTCHPVVPALRPFRDYYIANLSTNPTPADVRPLFANFAAYRRACEISAPPQAQ